MSKKRQVFMCVLALVLACNVSAVQSTSRTSMPATHTGASATQGGFSWVVTGSLGFPRTYHTSTLLEDGRVLVAGGNGTIVVGIGELYDPVAGTWQVTTPMVAGRTLHTATRLMDGRVLAVGGFGVSGPLSIAEVFDPGTGSWTPAGSLADARFNHTATLLPDGRVLVTGGQQYAPVVLASVEIYDPESNVWTSAAPMSIDRFDHSANLLHDGRVLVACGIAFVPDNGGYTVLNSFELYDPSTNVWSTPGQTVWYQTGHASVRLVDGRVLLVGGESPGGYSAMTQVFDPITNSWAAAGFLSTVRSSPTVIATPAGRAMAIGGSDGTPLSSTEILDPVSLTWTPGSPLQQRRFGLAATLLSDDRVLVVGGYDSLSQHTPYLSESEISSGPVEVNPGVCIVDDVSGDTFYQVTDPSSSLYAWWYYRIGSTGEQISGKASTIRFVPGRLLESSDRDYSSENPTYFMTARVNLVSGAGQVQLRRIGTATSRILRDRNFRDDPPCN